MLAFYKSFEAIVLTSHLSVLVDEFFEALSELSVLIRLNYTFLGEHFFLKELFLEVSNRPLLNINQGLHRPELLLGSFLQRLHVAKLLLKLDFKGILLGI